MLNIRRNSFLGTPLRRIWAVNIDTGRLIVKFSPHWVELAGFRKVLRGFRTSLHRTIMSSAPEEEKRFVWMQSDRMSVIRKSALPLVHCVFTLSTAEARLPVPP